MENLAQKNFMRSVTIYTYITGMPDFWFEELKWSPSLIFLRNCITRAMSIVNFVLILMLWFMPLCLHSDMSIEEVCSTLMYSLSEPLFYAGTIWLEFFKKDMTELIQDLVVYAPTVCCDPGVQKRMIKKAKMFILLILGSLVITVGMVGMEGMMRTKDDLFITIIFAWPDLDDRNQIAGGFRVFTYVVWWMLVFRISGALAIALCLMTYTSHQFIQLQNHFYGLAHIVDEDLSQLEKERKYEEGLTIGFQFHTDIVRFTRKLVKTCNVTYGAAVVANVITVVVTLIRLANDERSLINILTNAVIGWTVLVITGFYIWNLGDITIEAHNLTTAMYMSGWENFHGTSSLRMRKLLLVAMAQTQNPLTIKALGVITVSYSSFVSIVKFSYSVFSVVV